jgi:prepilin-type N-terminal cleavage/methylation domain-containing protein
MDKKAFTLIELLVVIAIISILLGISVYWGPRYIQARKIENETHKIYHLLKRYQVKAKVEKVDVTVFLTDDGKTLVFHWDSKNDNYTLRVPFKIENRYHKFKINQFGFFFFPYQGNIHIKENPLPNVSFDCVKVAQIRICEGKWNGSECICKY